MAGEGSVVGGKINDLLALDETFRPAPVFDDLGDGAGLESVRVLIVPEITHPCHAAILMHDLAENSCRGEVGHAREVHRSFGVTRPAQDSVISCLQRKDVSGLDEGIGMGMGIGSKKKKPATASTTTTPHKPVRHGSGFMV